MGARSGAALKTLQWVLRAIQLACAALIFSIYSYFLATLHNHDLRITTFVRAVEGISGAAIVYTLAGLLLVCCVAGFALTSFLAILFDVAFIGAFIYVAVANKNGAGSCKGYLDTPFGKGQDDRIAKGDKGFTALPDFHTACRLQTACLAVAIIAIVFFILSILTEVGLARHHRKEKRFGPSPANNYTSGYARTPGGLINRLLRRNTPKNPEDDNILPEHANPDQLSFNDNRQSYAPTEVNSSNGNAYYGAGTENETSPYKQETGYGYPTAGYGVRPGGGYQPTPQHYGDGVFDRV